MFKSRAETVKLSNIVLDRVALRNKVDKEADTWPNFVQSIREKGILNPPSARIMSLPTDHPEYATLNGKYCIVDGMHRYEGAVEAGLTEIPLNVYDVSDPTDIMMLQIIGNVHKVDTKPVQYRSQIQRILAHNEGKLTQEDLAKMFNRSTSWIQKIMGLNNLTEAELAFVEDGSIPMTNAYALSRLPEKERQEGNWVERAQTTDPETFVAEATQRASTLNKRPNAKEEWTAPIQLRKKGDIQNRWVDAYNDSKVEQLTAEDIERIKEEASQAYYLGMYAGLSYALSQDPETVQQKKAEHDARAAESLRKKSEAERQELAEKAAKKGASILAPKGAWQPLGT